MMPIDVNGVPDPDPQDIAQVIKGLRKILAVDGLEIVIRPKETDDS